MDVATWGLLGLRQLALWLQKVCQHVLGASLINNYEVIIW